MLVTGTIWSEYFSLTCAGRCVTCSWIRLNVTLLYRHRVTHVSHWRAIVRGGGEVIGVGEVGQRQKAVVLHCGASTALLNHAVQLQLRGPVKHLTLIWQRSHNKEYKETHIHLLNKHYFCEAYKIKLLLKYSLVCGCRNHLKKLIWQITMHESNFFICKKFLLSEQITE